MTGNGCLVRSRVRYAVATLALLGSTLGTPSLAAARSSRRITLSPLPRSDYTTRSPCPPPARGHASCLALELVPTTPDARSHKYPLGRDRTVGMAAAAKTCEPPKAAENCYGLRPQDLHGAYALPTTSFSSQMVAIVDAYDDPNAEADLKVYDEEFGLPPCTAANGCFAKVNEKGQAGPLPETEGGWAEEISLDVEVSHAICQNCRIMLVEASDSSYVSLEAAEETAALSGATEISNSWGGGEPLSDSKAYDHPGIIVTAASGDFGYLNWQSQNLGARGSVDYPASSPHVIAVGGTRLSLSSEGTWAGESVWNGDGAGGSGCSERYTAPAWQLDLANWASVGCKSARAVTDVSADADPYTGVAVYDSTPILVAKGAGAEEVVLGWVAVGGTSLATPLIASTFALAGGAGGVEYPATTLYASEITTPGSLHDVQAGSNGQCAHSFNYETGLSGCTAEEEAQASCAGAAICLAGPGYDGPSGVGSPDGVTGFEPVAEPAKQTQTVEFTSTAPGSAAVGGPTYTVAATASSGLRVSFSSGTPWICSLEGSTVSFIGAGTCILDANQAGNSEYSAAPTTQQAFSVGKGSQTIQFRSAAPTAATVGGPPYTVQATATSGLPVTYSSATSSVCSLEGSTVTFTSVGVCTIDAAQPGNSNYLAASQAQQSFSVGKGVQHITFTTSPPSTATVGGSPYPVFANASSGLPVSLTSATSSVCVLEGGGAVSFVAGGTCTINANQGGDSDYEPAALTQQSFTVTKQTQLITFTSTAPAAATIGGAMYMVMASASSGLPVVFTSETPLVCSLEGDLVSFVGAGTCTVQATQAGDSQYQAALAVEQTFLVSRRTQTVDFLSTAPTSARVGGPSYVVSAQASSGLSVSLSSATPSVCRMEGSTASFVGAGTCTLEAGQSGDADYEAAPTVQQSFAVLPLLMSPLSPSSAPTPISPSKASTPISTSPLASPLAQGASFTLIGAPRVNARSGAVTFRISVSGAGRLDVLIALPPPRPWTRKCSAKRRCFARTLVFGRGHAIARAAGTVEITVKPTVQARRTFSDHKRPAAIAKLTFRSSLGASPAARRVSFTVVLAKGWRQAR